MGESNQSNEPKKQPGNHPINQLTNRQIKRPTKQPINEPTNQSIQPSTDQPINRPTTYPRALGLTKRFFVSAGEHELDLIVPAMELVPHHHVHPVPFIGKTASVSGQHRNKTTVRQSRDFIILRMAPPSHDPPPPPLSFLCGCFIVLSRLIHFALLSPKITTKKVNENDIIIHVLYIYMLPWY